MSHAETAGIDHVARDAAARESIFASIRQSLAASVPLNDLHSKQDLRDVVSLPAGDIQISRTQLLERFQKNLGSIGGYCRLVANESEATEAVGEIIESLDANRIAVSDSPLIAKAVGNLTGKEIVKNADVEYLFGCDVGITGAQWAIAETGTLVLISDVERHRLTSLVPPVHICVLQTKCIRQSLGEILELISKDLSRTVTFITGASRTSDIELTLAIGVHGPKELHVILIAE